jgi:hypothetical protein
LCYDVWMPYELPNMIMAISCNSYVVDPYFIGYLWDVILYYVLDIWVDAYSYPILYYLFWSN